MGRSAQAFSPSFLSQPFDKRLVHNQFRGCPPTLVIVSCHSHSPVDFLLIFHFHFPICPLPHSQPLSSPLNSFSRFSLSSSISSSSSLSSKLNAGAFFLCSKQPEGTIAFWSVRLEGDSHQQMPLLLGTFTRLEDGLLAISGMKGVHIKATLKNGGYSSFFFIQIFEHGQQGVLQ